MKRTVLALASAILICNSAFAAYRDGSDLVGWWKEYEKSQAGREFSTLEVGCYVGYVGGVVDTLDEIAFDIPVGVKLSQIHAIVGKYLDDHPSDWNLAADVLVTRALKKAFPKK